MENLCIGFPGQRGGGFCLDNGKRMYHPLSDFITAKHHAYSKKMEFVTISTLYENTRVDVTF